LPGCNVREWKRVVKNVRAGGCGIRAVAGSGALAVKWLSKET